MDVNGTIYIYVYSSQHQLSILKLICNIQKDRQELLDVEKLWWTPGELFAYLSSGAANCSHLFVGQFG